MKRALMLLAAVMGLAFFAGCAEENKPADAATEAVKDAKDAAKDAKEAAKDAKDAAKDAKDAAKDAAK